MRRRNLLPGHLQTGQGICSRALTRGSIHSLCRNLILAVQCRVGSLAYFVFLQSHVSSFSQSHVAVHGENWSPFEFGVRYTLSVES